MLIDQVDDRTADDILSGVRDLAAACAEPGLGRSERLARLSMAGERAAHLATVAQLLDPYADRQHSRLWDAINAAGPAHRRDVDAAGRLDQARAADGLRAGMQRAVDLGAGLGRPVAGPPLQPIVARWLAGYAAPAGELGPAASVPGVLDALPAATINAAKLSALPGVQLSLADGASLPWTTSTIHLNRSRQSIDWTPQQLAEFESILEAAVDVGLERQLLVDVTAAAPTAASFEAAEIAVGAAWPAGADLILVHGADRPKVVREYAAAQLHAEDRPVVLATGGVTAGTAVVLAAGAVLLEASSTDWMAADEPALLGQAATVLRYGRARLRVAGAVQLVEVA